MPVSVAVTVMGVVSVIIITEIMYPFKRESADTIGNTVETNRNPGTVVIGRRVPDIPSAEVIAVGDKEQVIWNSRGNIKTQFGRSNKFRRLVDNYRLGGIHGSNNGGNADINPHAHTNVGGMSL
jgi:hypothetical protein